MGYLSEGTPIIICILPGYKKVAVEPGKIICFERGNRKSTSSINTRYRLRERNGYGNVVLISIWLNLTGRLFKRWVEVTPLFYAVVGVPTIAVRLKPISNGGKPLLGKTLSAVGTGPR